MAIQQHEELETCRIVLLQSRQGILEVFLGSQDAQRILPQIKVQPRQRIAPQLTAAVKELYGIEAVLVASAEALIANSEHIVYQVMEPQKTEREALRHEDWVTIDSLAKNSFRDSNDFLALQQAVAQTSGEDECPRPFARLGWFSDLQHWVEAQIEPRGLHLTGRFFQLNACATFSLIRFETTGPAVWFKAVGAPNQREYLLTMMLVRSIPRFLPQIIAVRPEFNGWLAREVEGSLLMERGDLLSWEAAARDLAQLQISSIERNHQLLDAGARDLRTSTLANLAGHFLGVMADLMDSQTRVPPRRLSRDELGDLSARLEGALSLLEETRIPMALGHLDFNPQNIVCSPNGSVFLDWAEAFLGHPFLTFEYLLEHFRRAFGGTHAQEESLILSYSEAWRALVSEDAIRRALLVSPLIAVFACATGNDSWRDAQRLQDPRTIGYLRSLTRRMDRHALRLSGWRLSCAS